MNKRQKVKLYKRAGFYHYSYFKQLYDYASKFMKWEKRNTDNLKTLCLVMHIARRMCRIEPLEYIPKIQLSSIYGAFPSDESINRLSLLNNLYMHQRDVNKLIRTEGDFHHE